MPVTQQPEYIATLDGWRAVAISIVVLSHVALFFAGDGRMVDYIVRTGGQGVALFFAISGYLITTLLLNEFRDTGRISLAAFYLKRVFRILPAALTFLIVLYFASVAGAIILERGELLAGAFFYSNYWPDRSWFTAHFWSLSVEEHFYLFWPAVLAAAGPSAALRVAGFVIVATAVWRPFGFGIDMGVSAIQRTDMRLDAFMFAGGLAILLHAGKLRGLVSSRWTLPGAVVALFAANIAAIVFPLLKNFKEIAQAGLMPLMVVSTVYRPGDLVSTVLEWKPLRLIGMWSYSIYLWQQLFITSAIPGSLPLKAVFLCGAVFLSYTLVEQPCRRFGRRLLKVHRAAPAAESALSSSVR